MQKMVETGADYLLPIVEQECYTTLVLLHLVYQCFNYLDTKIQAQNIRIMSEVYKFP